MDVVKIRERERERERASNHLHFRRSNTRHIPTNPFRMKTHFMHERFKKFPSNSVESLLHIELSNKSFLLAFRGGMNIMIHFLCYRNIVNNVTVRKEPPRLLFLQKFWQNGVPSISKEFGENFIRSIAQAYRKIRRKLDCLFWV